MDVREILLGARDDEKDTWSTLLDDQVTMEKVSRRRGDSCRTKTNRSMEKR
jgi:hypothetical protein